MNPKTILQQTAHRPYPLPSGRWVMLQSWHNLLFAHWPVSLESLRPHVPDALEIDTYEGQAWMSVVPFRMSGVRPRMLPAINWLSNFEEMNVRTYVKAEGKEGVWFFSLDASQPVAVEIARAWYNLPYFNAKMKCEVTSDGIEYTSKRTDRRTAGGELRVSYRPTSAVFHSKIGSLDEWLTERYCLFTAKGDQIYRGDIHHVRWPLQKAGAEFHTNTAAQAFGFDLSSPPPLIQYVERLDIIAWPIKRI